MNVIDSIDQLRACSRIPAVLRFLRRVPDIEFALPAFSAADNRIATERLTNYRRACGCFAGGLVMSFSILGFFANYALSGRTVVDVGITDLLLFFGLFMVSTFAGKSFGIVWARARAILLVRHLVVTATR